MHTTLFSTLLVQNKISTSPMKLVPVNRPIVPPKVAILSVNVTLALLLDIVYTEEAILTDTMVTSRWTMLRQSLGRSLGCRRP